MNQYLKLIFQRYLLLLFSLSFFFITLSPYFQNAAPNMLLKLALSLFIHRINIISIFSLLFATLTTIQTYENQNINAAISMSGMHSFRIIRPVIFFALTLSVLNLLINQFFLGTSLKILNKDFCLTDNNQKLHVKELNGKYIFYTEDFKNFTTIDEDKNILYAKEGHVTSSGIDLFYTDHFQKIGGIYEKISSSETYHLEINPEDLLDNGSAFHSDSLTTLFKWVQKERGSKGQKIAINFFYKLLHPFIHLFAVSFGALFAFSRIFRKKHFLSLFTCLFSSLFFLYLLEGFFLLAEANILSSYYFLVTALAITTFFPLLLYVKKV